MSYRAMKLQIPKISDVVPVDFIKNRRFNKIIQMLHGKTSLSQRDRYLYGYSWLRVGEYLQALLTWWPLVLKGHANLQADCTVIVEYIVQDKNFVVKLNDCDEKASFTLLQITQKLIPNSHIPIIIKKQLLDFLWQKQDYAQLERILKSTKDELSGILLENLGKLWFLQAESKLPGNIMGFVGWVFTGGAGLILRNTAYHQDISAEIYLLAEVLTDLFVGLGKKSSRLGWDVGLFENVVNYEASILIEVLKLAISDSGNNLDIIPTPGYLIMNNSTSDIKESFLVWLAEKNPKLFKLYDPDVYYAVVWSLGGDRLPKVKSVVKTIVKDKLHPYLRLAIMLKAAAIRQPLKNLVQLAEFENLDESSDESIDIFRNVAIQTILAIINVHNPLDIKSRFGQLLLEFYPVVSSSSIDNIVIKNMLLQLSDEYKEQRDLNLAWIRELVKHTKHYDFAKQIEFLCQRQRECLEFLARVQFSENSRRIIGKIKDQTSLRLHLTLIADCFGLVAASLSEHFFAHMEDLITSKAVNKLIKLEDGFDFGCGCYECYQVLCNNSIPNMVDRLNLSVARIPDFVDLKPTTKTRNFKFELSGLNPFAVLDVGICDPKPIIMQKVMQLMRQHPEKMATIRQAQSMLFDPAQRFLHHYLRYLSHEPKDEVNEVGELVNPSVAELPLDIGLRREFLNDN